MMVRITEVAATHGMAHLRVEGRGTGHAVGELRSASEAALAARRGLMLDVAGLTFVDPTGIELLRGLVRRGTVLVGCSGFLHELLRGSQMPALAPATVAGEPDSEAALIARLRRGDGAAFETLVRQYAGRMLATARRMLGSDEDAQDAVQDAFTSAFKAMSSFSGAAKLSTWLHRIVVNAALMKLRTRRRKPEDSIEDLLPQFDSEGHWVDSPAEWGASGDILLQRRETRAMVRRCIESLPDPYRTVLMLRDIEDLDTEEVAQSLGITPNAVKIRLHRARQALRTLLERELVAQERGH